ncbi:MAG: site-2 protease family protein [bacterium]|nr:site-2 protease family protein [bacterium]
MEPQFLFALLVLLFSVVIHEVSHGFAALFLGDRTAEYEGRLTLNPIKHIDPIGTIVFPFISMLIGGFIFGWAKPVPYNPYNLRNRRWGEAIVAFAGPLSNIILALIFGLFMRFYLLPQGMALDPIGIICMTIVIVNIALAIFNLVPVPPLDGSKILTAFLPANALKARQAIERLGFFGVLIFIFLFWRFFAPVIPWAFTLITGASFGSL